MLLSRVLSSVGFHSCPYTVYQWMNPQSEVYAAKLLYLNTLNKTKSTPNVAIQWLALTLRIRKDSVSNLSPKDVLPYRLQVMLCPSSSPANGGTSYATTLVLMRCALLFFFPPVTKIAIWGQILVNFPNIKLQENPSRNRVVPCGQTRRN